VDGLEVELVLVDDTGQGAELVDGALARVFDQDEFNLEAVQKRLRTTRKSVVTFAVYQESKIRHFHHLLDRWLAAPQ